MKQYEYLAHHGTPEQIIEGFETMIESLARAADEINHLKKELASISIERDNYRYRLNKLDALD